MRGGTYRERLTAQMDRRLSTAGFNASERRQVIGIALDVVDETWTDSELASIDEPRPHRLLNRHTGG
jgi:hypothetical protein